MAADNPVTTGVTRYIDMIPRLLSCGRGGILRLLALVALALPAAPPPAADEGIRLPDMGTSADRVMSPREEAALGADVYRQLRRSGALLEDLLVESYLQELGSRIAAHSGTPEQRFHFFLVRNEAINAFAVPGGYIGINAGLMVATDEESELASVLAHEIAHVTQRHIARRMEAMRGMNWATAAAVVAAILASGGNPEVAQAALSSGMAASVDQTINFTLRNELEADRVGIGMLAEAGFDPRAMATFFEEIERQSRFYESAYGEFIRTHPVNSARVSEALSRAQRLAAPTRTDDTRYHLMQARVRALVVAQPDDAIRYFQAARRNATGMRAEAADYGLAVAQARIGQTAPAQAIAARYADATRPAAPWLLLLAQTQARQGALDAALATLARAERTAPEHPAITLLRAEYQLQAGEPAAARQTLLAERFAGSAASTRLRLLAQAADETGQDGAAHYYLAEHYLQEDRPQDAALQLRLALADGDLSELERARATLRLEELERRAD